MDIKQAIKERHSVRQYTNRIIDDGTVSALQAEINACNTEGGLHMQLIINEPKAFGSFMVHYGRFKGVTDYIALIGKKQDSLDEKIGYYGERVALTAQSLGLNSCWVAVTFGKSFTKKNCDIGKDEKLISAISLGYGVLQGIPHKSKPMEALCKANANMPDWFKEGMESAMLAPTALNQQKFLITLNGDTVKSEAIGGSYSKVDLGIVKYHFEIGAGTGNFKWA